MYLLYKRGFAICSIIFSLISLFIRFRFIFNLIAIMVCLGFMMILVLKYSLIVFKPSG